MQFGRQNVFQAAVATAIATAAVALSPMKAVSQEETAIALFVAIQANPVEQAIINAFNEVAKEDGNVRFVVFDSDNSVQKELANCSDAIAANRYKAFALKAVAGPPLMECANKALAAGIPVVAFGNALGPDPHTADRQIDGLSASVVELAKSNGLAVAELVNEACNSISADPCNVIYTFGPLAFDWASITRQFFTDTVAEKYKNINVVASGANDFDPNTARTLVKSLMQSHGDTHVIASDGDLGAIGVVAGLKDINLEPGKDVLVTGGAISNQGKDLIESGQMYGSTCLMPITEAKMAAEFAIKAARGEAIETPDVEVCAVAAPTGLSPITAANIGQFTPEW
jgi:ribose transport system substrate-binding protein